MNFYFSTSSKDFAKHSALLVDLDMDIQPAISR